MKDYLVWNTRKEISEIDYTYLQFISFNIKIKRKGRNISEREIYFSFAHGDTDE